VVGTHFAFFYLMRADARGIPEAVPDHVAHWRGLGLGDYLGRPFQDRTGGLITFRAEAVHRAEQAVATDPFVVRGLVDAYWLKPWTPE
jgi:hypothetical protein